MFYNGDTRNHINISTECGTVKISPLQDISKQVFDLSIESQLGRTNNPKYRFQQNLKIPFLYQLDKKLNLSLINKNKIGNQHLISSLIHSIKIKTYCFSVKKLHKLSDNSSFLLPPFGNNLPKVLDLLPDFKSELVHIFNEYGLKLVFDKASQSLKIMKEQKDGSIFLLPYSSIADTLQRIIFYKTAVASNQNSVLLFEEPEAHAFPPYIVEITQEIIRSKTNQFFITTHSPFVVNDFLENAIDDLAIFMLDYKDGQTTAKALTKEQLREVYEYGVDLFTNNENYL
jgi:AAA15 family ATPase/GTPase